MVIYIKSYYESTDFILLLPESKFKRIINNENIYYVIEMEIVCN